MNQNSSSKKQKCFADIMQRHPQATAAMKGSDEYPDIEGTVLFYQTECGVLVVSNINGLPKTTEICKSPIFAMHIHEGTSCSGDMSDPFAKSMTHFNPDNCPHPYHAGDMPPLFGNNGYAFSAFLTDRFNVTQVLGRAVIIHRNPDDFTTQPSGNSGAKIACGLIHR